MPKKLIPKGFAESSSSKNGTRSKSGNDFSLQSERSNWWKEKRKLYVTKICSYDLRVSLTATWNCCIRECQNRSHSLPWLDCHTPTSSHWTFALNCSLSISIYLKLLSISIFTVFISYHVSYLIYNFITSTATFTCTSPALYIYLYIYITSALITFIAAHVLTAHTTYILCHTVYTLFIYIYITICTYSALFYFALLVRC